MNRSFRLALAALPLLAGSSARALDFGVFKTGDHIQSADASASAAVNWRFSGVILPFAPGAATLGTLTLPSSATRSMTPSVGDAIEYADGGYATPAALNAVFGSGTYGFSVDAGTLAGQTGSLTVGADNYATTTPFLTGTGYSSLQNLNASSAVSLTWNTFVGSGASDDRLTFFDVFDAISGANVFSNYGAADTYTGQTIAGGTFVAGNTYVYQLVYSNRIYNTGSGFNGGFPIVGFDKVTVGEFNVVPEPASLAALGVGAAALLRRRRTVR